MSLLGVGRAKFGRRLALALRVVESLHIISGGCKERRGLSPTECFNLIPLSV